jgi:polyketide biosynthesis enoyl-CoA hydratase PksH
MNREAVVARRSGPTLALTLNRSDQSNSIDRAMLRALHERIAEAEADSSCRLLTLQGSQGVFCTGMDFAESLDLADDALGEMTHDYMAILMRISQTRLVVVAKVDGRVLAGGVGLAAACDLVVATNATQFCLTELLWGAMPACVLPWLMRRTGFQPGYAMALSAAAISAEEARRVNLIDVISDDLEAAVRKLSVRLLRVESSSVAQLKRYCQTLSTIDDRSSRRAIDESARAMTDPRVRRNIASYVLHERYPWEEPSADSSE